MAVSHMAQSNHLQEGLPPRQLVISEVPYRWPVVQTRHFHTTFRQYLSLLDTVNGYFCPLTLSTTLFTKRNAGLIHPFFLLSLGHWPYCRVMSILSMHDVRFTDIHSSPKEMQPRRTCVSFGEECSMYLTLLLNFDNTCLTSEAFQEGVCPPRSALDTGTWNTSKKSDSFRPHSFLAQISFQACQ